MAYSRGRRRKRVSDRAAYGIELKSHVVVVLAVLVTLVAIGFVLVVETGLYSGLPEVFDGSSNCVCDSVVRGGGGRLGRASGWGCEGGSWTSCSLGGAVNSVSAL